MNVQQNEKLIQYVISSNLDMVNRIVTGSPPSIDEFPLCGKWRKPASLLHISAAYGSLTCIQFFLGKIDANIATSDVDLYVMVLFWFFLDISSLRCC